MEKFVIEKEVGMVRGCKLVLKRETDFLNSDDAILDINSAEVALEIALKSCFNFKSEEKQNG